MENTVLKLNNLGKKFSGNSVLRNVNIELKKGQILGLMGVNGSGKSTMLNIISGDHIIDETGGYEGDIFIDGQKVKITSTVESQSYGICMVHQEFSLLEDLSIWENIALPNYVMNSYREIKGSMKNFYTEENKRKAKEILARLGLDLDVEMKICELPINNKQFVEIARSIANEDTKLLMLDEPTATLNEKDSNKLLEQLKKLADEGLTIILVSHRIEEIIAVSDTILVLRDGDPVYLSDKKEEFSREKIAEEIIGYNYAFAERFKENEAKQEKVVLTYKDFYVARKNEPIKNLNFDIYQSEIIGLTGMNGHGKNALAYGTLRADKIAGDFTFYKDEKEIKINKTAEAIESGIVFVTEERRKNGLLLDKSVAENINFYLKNFSDKLDRLSIGNKIKFYDKNKEKNQAETVVTKYDVVCESIRQPICELSGGNQQKVALARAILMDPDVLFINEPTRGIDIKSKDNILKLLADLNKRAGTTIILASGDIEEMKKICDRICVFYEGELVDVLKHDADAEQFARAFSKMREEDSYEKV